MSREEASKRLAGTFAFELRGGRVLVQDESLLDEIRAITNATASYAAPTHRLRQTGISGPRAYGTGA